VSHMVIYRTGDGQPGYHQADELDQAVEFVERLRNGEGVNSARIFHMEEVNFDFRPYFKVEIGPSGESTKGPTADSAPAPEPETEPIPEPEPAPIPEPAAMADTPAPAPPPPSGDAWGDLSGDVEGEPTPLVEQAAAFMPDVEEAEPPPAEGNGNGNGHDGEGVGVRRGLFGR